MSLTYRIEKHPDLLIVSGEGSITQADRVAAIRQWLNDPDYRPGLNTLCDVSRIESVPSMAELHEIVEMLMHRAVEIGRKKLAIVTAKPIAFGVARQFSMLAEPMQLEIEVFSTCGEAMAWLGAETPRL